MFTQLGKVDSQLDAKNRIRMPAKFRAQYGDKYVLLPGTEGCIWLFREDDTDSPILSALRNLESLDPTRQRQMRAVFSLGANKESDEQGRFSLTPDLIKFANISKDIRLVPTNQKIEIWSAEIYKEKFGEEITTDLIDDIYSSLNIAGKE